MEISKNFLTFEENLSLKLRYKNYNYDKIENFHDKQAFGIIPSLINAEFNKEEFIKHIRANIDKTQLNKVVSEPVSIFNVQKLKEWVNNGKLKFCVTKDGTVSQINNSTLANYDFYNRTHFFFGVFVYDANKSNNIAGCYSLIRKVHIFGFI